MSAALARIAGVGARGPLGLNALQMAMCARAERVEPRSTPFLDRRGDEIGAVITEALPADLFGFDRLAALGAPALEEACPASFTAPLPLFLALPEAGRPGDDPRLAAHLVDALAAESGVAVDARRSRVFRAGHAGGALALEAAIGALGEAPAAIVGGIDSYYHPETLAWLDEERRLAGTRDADEGILPSEAAAFFLITPAQRGGGTTVRRVETGREEALGPDEPGVAGAMTRLMRAAVDAAGGSLAWALTDLNGERHRTKEWARVVLRLALSERFARHDAVFLLGEIGAATGPALAVLATVWIEVGCAPATQAIVALHSDGPERGAILLEAT